MVEERAFWLAWSSLNGIGPILLKRLQKQFGSLAKAWAASSTDLLNVEGLGPQTVETIAIARRKIHPEQLLDQHQHDNPNFWTPADVEYPRLLLETPDPPPVLYYRGKVDLQELAGTIPTVAIVGTRSPSPYGRKWTQRITTALAQNGFTVVSGLADGIDTEVHRSCLESQRRTIAVLGCGVDVIYPGSNRTLYQQVLESGLVLSEHPAGTQPDRIFFPRRNRIIAGLCRATLVMEAPAKSGALITAHYANEYGRDVYALPGRLDDKTAIGCLKLINKGAHLIEGIDELLDMLGMLPQFNVAPLPSTVEQPTLPLNLEPKLEQVLQVLTDLSQSDGSEAISFDQLVQSIDLPASSVSSALLQLELMGLVAQLPGMRYQRT
ncbi:MAG: DNA-protecting protein DprA [Leptolyngbyaceae cyanobacterium RU_5_1]|nr:DNA-protecting protein DprA [Leptolyngbyaceae cyanobacterium RU_5_1]